MLKYYRENLSVIQSMHIGKGVKIHSPESGEAVKETCIDSEHSRLLFTYPFHLCLQVV